MVAPRERREAAAHAVAVEVVEHVEPSHLEAAADARRHRGPRVRVGEVGQRRELDRIPVRRRAGVRPNPGQHALDVAQGVTPAKGVGEVQLAVGERHGVRVLVLAAVVEPDPPRLVEHGDRFRGRARLGGIRRLLEPLGGHVHHAEAIEVEVLDHGHRLVGRDRHALVALEVRLPTCERERDGRGRDQVALVRRADDDLATAARADLRLILELSGEAANPDQVALFDGYHRIQRQIEDEHTLRRERISVRLGVLLLDVEAGEIRPVRVARLEVADDHALDEDLGTRNRCRGPGALDVVNRCERIGRIAAQGRRSHAVCRRAGVLRPRRCAPLAQIDVVLIRVDSVREARDAAVVDAGIVLETRAGTFGVSEHLCPPRSSRRPRAHRSRRRSPTASGAPFWMRFESGVTSRSHSGVLAASPHTTKYSPPASETAGRAIVCRRPHRHPLPLTSSTVQPLSSAASPPVFFSSRNSAASVPAWS